MQIKSLLSAPPAATVVVVLIFLAVLLNREASTKEGLPVFLPNEQGFICVEMSGAGLQSGIYQFNDGLTLEGAIKLTEPSLLKKMTKTPGWSSPLRNGESLRFVKKDQKISILHQGWMKASHRVAMAIPLHPDRMTIKDWMVLPGIGAKLAERIENSRQNNGDFGSLEALKRVKGIGEKRVRNWRKFFFEV